MLRRGRDALWDFWVWQIVRRLERGDAFWLPPGSPWWMQNIANSYCGAAHDERIRHLHTRRELSMAFGREIVAVWKAQNRQTSATSTPPAPIPARFKLN